MEWAARFALLTQQQVGPLDDVLNLGPVLPFIRSIEAAVVHICLTATMEDEAAAMIQASFRGFVVRQCQPLRKLRLIADIRLKLKKLEMRASDPTYIDKLCTDPMENRKMKEEIMALLLELDAIQGVLPAVRRIRKSVTRDVVQFQEIVDAVKVDSAVRIDTEEATRPSQQAANVPQSEQTNPRPTAPPYPALRRVVSLDDNVYPEQSYAHRVSKKKTSEPSSGDASNRSSDEDGAPRRRSEGWVKNPLLQRSMSGTQRTAGTKGPSLVRTFSELPRNGVWNPLTGRSVGEGAKKPTNKSPPLGRTHSFVQREKIIATPATAATSVLKTHRSQVSNERAPPVVTTPPPVRQKVVSLSREEAAVSIQSTFRGHLSRRSRPLYHLRTISVVNNRLRELNQELANPVCVARLRSDAMERLKWSEEITALLLKLDSVQGVVQAIRDIRKSVTREVIKLQEDVDSIIHEADILSRLAAMESDTSTTSSEHLELVPDEESLDKERAVEALGNESGTFNRNPGTGEAGPEEDSPLWDDKFMDLREPRASGHGYEGSSASCPGQKGNNEGELKPEDWRAQRKLKRILSGSVESSRYSESQDAFEIQQSDILSSGRFPTEDGRSLILSSSVSTAGETTEGMQQQQPLSVGGARFQKKPKRLEKEKVQSGVINGSVSPDSEASAAAGNQCRLEINTNGYAEKPVEADGTSRPAEALLGTSDETQACVYSSSVPDRQSSEEFVQFVPFDIQLHGDSSDVVMLAEEELNPHIEYTGCENGKSVPSAVTEERACEFLRSRVGHYEGLRSGRSGVTQAETPLEHLPTTKSDEPGVRKPSEGQWEVERLTELEEENARLKLYLGEVLTYAESQAEDLKIMKKRLAFLEKERQNTKRDDTGVRKKPSFARRRR
ncbi:hypothetical protein R1sor_024686 [Riccia sorocarpa]|uniref:BAG domain-containing protein n=1 Tax=Riccia sorocarpa TaxID=122646 RepID=A0ABD3GUE7_9MARC